MPEKTNGSAPRRARAGKFSPKRRRKTVLAGQIAGAQLEASFRRRGFAQGELVRRWQDIVGAELARVSQPSQLKFRRGEQAGGTLVIRVEGAFAPLLQHQLEQVRERVNGYFGYAAVGKVQLIQGRIVAPRRRRAPEPELDAATAEALEKGLEKSEDPGLRTALLKLGRLIYAAKGDR